MYIKANIIFIGAAGGLILGTFKIGFFLPVIKSKATFLGGVSGFAVMVWISIGMNVAVVSGKLRAETKSLSVDACEKNITITNTIHNNEEVFMLYRISSLWYTIIGMMVTVVVSCILSIFMERNDASKMDRRLFTPLIYRWLPKKPTAAENEMSLLENQDVHTKK